MGARVSRHPRRQGSGLRCPPVTRRGRRRRKRWLASSSAAFCKWRAGSLLRIRYKKTVLVPAAKIGLAERFQGCLCHDKTYTQQRGIITAMVTTQGSRFRRISYSYTTAVVPGSVYSSSTCGSRPRTFYSYERHTKGTYDRCLVFILVGATYEYTTTVRTRTYTRGCGIY